MYGSPAVTIPFPNSGGCRWRPPQMEWAVGHLPPDDPRLGRFQRLTPRIPEPEPGLDTAPAFITKPDERAWKDEEYIYRPRVVDATGNASTWYLEDGPEGMTIDRHSGEVSWHPKKSARVSVAIGVRNAYGGTRRQCWTLRVRHPGVLRPPAPVDATAGDPRPWAFRFVHPDKPLVLAPPAKSLQSPHPAIPGLELVPHPADGWAMAILNMKSCNVTRYEYDSKGNLIKTTSPQDVVTTNVYDQASGRLLRSTDAAGNRSDYEYDEDGNLLSITQVQADGTRLVQSRNEYNRASELIRSFDSTGTETTYKYDGSGRRIEVSQYTTDPATGVRHVTVTTNQYDSAGRIMRTLVTIDGVADGLARNYVYNDAGHMSLETDKYGLATVYVYDQQGQQVEVRREVKGSDGISRWLVSRTVYDQQGRVVCQTAEQLLSDPAAFAAGRATVTVYDILGRSIATEEREGVVVSLSLSGQVGATAVAAVGTVVTRTAQGYDGAGRTLWSENAAGVRTYYFYTREGQVDYTLIDLDGDLSTTADQSIAGKNLYDQYGRQVGSIVDRDGDLSTSSDQSITRYVYDTQGRVIRTNYDDGTSVSLTYDHMGRKRSETDQLGNTTWYEYDDMGRLAAVVLPAVTHPTTGQDVHVRYEYGYDASGNQTSLRDNIYQTDPENGSTIDRSEARETLFTYDWRGNQLSRTLPDGSTERFYYDAATGRQTRHVSFEGRVTVLEYDSLGRLTTKQYYSSIAAWNNGAGVSGHTISYSYDSQGRVVRESDSRLGETLTSYDSQGRTIRVESPSGILNYEYDAVTAQVSRTWTGSNAASPVTDVRNSYDALGRLETVTTYARDGQSIATPEQARYVYDKIGNLDQLRHANGIISDYVYDSMNRLSTLTHYAPDATPDDLSDNAVLQRFVYGYHDNGNKSGETATDASGATSTWNWDYDALGRLIEERHDNATDSLDYTAAYTFDLVGNRLVKTTRTDAGLERIESAFDANDRLLNERKVFDEVEVEVTAYSYNATEQTGKVVTNAQTGTKTQTSMTYNEQGRLSQITIHSYENNVLVKTVTQEYEYDSSGIKVRQTETVDTNGDGVVDESKTTSYLNDKQNHTGFSQVLEETVEVEGQAVQVTTYTIGHDVLAQFSAAVGFLSLLADGHGSTRAIADMAANIVQQYAYDAYGNAHGLDASQALTNLLYSGEQFNPVSGLQYLRARWYNPQSGTFNRLDPFAGDRQSPLSFHKYAYANNNPINFYDPTGNSAILLGIVAIGISIASGVALVNKFVDRWWITKDFEAIDRIEALNRLIRRLLPIGEEILNAPRDFKYRGGGPIGPDRIVQLYNENFDFSYYWKNLVRPAIKYQQRNYSEAGDWRVTYTQILGQHFGGSDGFNPSSLSPFSAPQIAREIIFGDPLRALSVMIHEPQHNYSQRWFGHSGGGIPDWDKRMDETLKYLVGCISNNQETGITLSHQWSDILREVGL